MGAVPETIVVLFPGALGDLCLLAPVLAALGARGARVEVSVQRSLVPVLKMLLPAAGVGPPIDGAAMSSLFGGELEPALARWLVSADHVHVWFARGDRDHEASARFTALGVPATWHAVPRDDGARHVSVDYAAALGIAAPVVNARVVPPPTSVVLPWRAPGPAGRLVIHPGAGAAAKMWALDGFRRVADAWRAAGGEVAVVLGPAEHDQLGAWRAAGHGPIVGLPIADVAMLVVSAPTWLGNDSGLSHLAGALDRRGVVLFGPTRAARWRPLATGLVTVEFRDRALDAVVSDVCARLESSAPPSCLDTPSRRH